MNHESEPADRSDAALREERDRLKAEVASMNERLMQWIQKMLWLHHDASKLVGTLREVLNDVSADMHIVAGQLAPHSDKFERALFEIMQDALMAGQSTVEVGREILRELTKVLDRPVYAKAESPSQPEGGAAALVPEETSKILASLGDVLTSIRIEVLAAAGELESHSDKIEQGSFPLMQQSMKEAEASVQQGRELVRQLRDALAGRYGGAQPPPPLEVTALPELFESLMDVFSTIRLEAAAAASELELHSDKIAPRASYQLMEQSMKEVEPNVQQGRELMRQLREIVGRPA